MQTISYTRAAQMQRPGIDFLSLASTPHDEECTQAGQDLESQLKECRALINQLQRIHGKEPEGAEFFIMENPHDFGTYYEAAIFYKESEGEEESESEDYAMIVESNIPDKWDAEALQELKEAGHPKHQPAKVIRIKAA